MPIPQYLQQDDEYSQRIPYLGNQDDFEEDDQEPQQFGAQAPPPQRPVGGTPPPPTASPELQQILNRPSTISGPPVVQQAQEARQRLAQAQANVPVAPQPKWWQRLGAGAIGGLAGISNTSGHRGAAIDPTAAEQGIMGVPQQQRRMAQYQAGVTAAQANAEAAQQAEQEWWKNRELNNKEALQAAEEERARGQAQFNRKRVTGAESRAKQQAAERLEAVMMKPWGEDAQLQPADAPVPDGMETTKSLSQPGMVWVHPPSRIPLPAELAPYSPGNKAGDIVPYGRYKRAQDAATKAQAAIDSKPAPNANEWQLYLDANGGDQKKALAQYRSDKIQIARESRATPAGERPKPANPAQLSAVTHQTKQDYTKAEQANLARIAKIRNSPVFGPNGQQIVDPKEVTRIRQEQIQASYDELNKAKQQIEDGYQERVGTLTGTYKEPAQYQPIQVGGGGGKPFPRAKLAEFAAANKLTPQQAEQRLSAQGYALQ